MPPKADMLPHLRRARQGVPASGLVLFFTLLLSIFNPALLTNSVVGSVRPARALKNKLMTDEGFSFPALPKPKPLETQAHRPQLPPTVSYGGRWL